MTRLGLLRHRVSIRKDSATDSNPVPSYSATPSGFFVKDIHAEIIDVAGGETFRGRQVAAEIDVIVTIRYVAGLKHNMRVETYEGTPRLLNIVKILDRTGRKRFLELHCAEDRT